MKVETSGLIIEFSDGELREVVKATQASRSLGKGKLLGFGVFTGMVEGEVPNVTSQQPEVGLQVIFRKDDQREGVSFVSGKITKVL